MICFEQGRQTARRSLGESSDGVIVVHPSFGPLTRHGIHLLLPSQSHHLAVVIATIFIAPSLV